MFQSFDKRTRPSQGTERVPLLRRELKARGLDGFLIPHGDEFQNEYPPAMNERLPWLTGFAGSAGACVVTLDEAVLFTDGRYTLQVRAETDGDVFTYADLMNPGVAGWLRAHAGNDAVIGFDPKLHGVEETKKLRAAVARAGATLRAVETNPVDAIWTDRPGLPADPAWLQPNELAGESAAAKRGRIAEALGEEPVDAAFLASPLSVAWLLNLRGADSAHNPVVMAQAIIHADAGVDLFIDAAKLTAEVRAALGEGVRAHEPEALEGALKALGVEKKRVGVDTALTSAWAAETLEAAGANVTPMRDPVSLPRAIKNAVELDGARAAHIRDGAAVTRFLHWFAHEAPKGHLDEIACARRLEEFRRETNALKDISFPSIVGAGADGAIIHYRVSEETNRPVRMNEMFLIDSGGQYEDGTTDVTRTLVVGEPTPTMRAHYTRVLKGHIALARLRFPEGTSGHAVDAIARAPLWEAGLDYDHGTGHGVGAYLAVHEGPQRIAKAPNDVALEPGMILSNEPGYYAESEYGIRIENLVVVTEPQPAAGGPGTAPGPRPMMGFEDLTLIPYERELIDADLLSAEERAWLDAYHARVLETLTPRLPAEVADWLKGRCKAI